MTALSVTLCFTVLLSQSSSVTADIVMKKQGDALTLTCTSKNSSYIGLYLKARLPEIHELVYFNQKLEPSYGSNYRTRLEVGGEFGKVTVKITDLKVSDSGLYLCEYVSMGKKLEYSETNSFLLFVNEEENLVTSRVTKDPEGSHFKLDAGTLASILTACAVFLVCVLVVGIWIFPKVKALCARPREDSGAKAYSGVYEDMRAHRSQL